MNSSIVKVLFALALAVAVTGCKLTVMVAEGGHVQSNSSGTCLEGNNCLVEIQDTSFSDTFTAIPAAGYVFHKWNEGDGFFCGGSTAPTCTVSVPDSALGDTIVASFENRGYIMPIFTFIGIDTDGDGIPNHIDEDDDNDGILDVDDPFPLDPGTGDCGSQGQELVFEVLNWVTQPGSTVIEVGAGTASEFTTTDSPTYEGTVTLVPSSGTDHVTQTMWISTCPGAAPLDQTYLFRDDVYYSCKVSGQEPSLRWTQGTADSVVECELEPNTTYYLNYTNEGCNSSNCPAIRNTYNNNEP